MSTVKNSKSLNNNQILEDEFGVSDFSLANHSMQLSSLCGSACSSKCSSNCGNKCASACSSKCGSACASLCIGAGASDAIDLTDAVSIVNIIL